MEEGTLLIGWKGGAPMEEDEGKEGGIGTPLKPDTSSQVTQVNQSRNAADFFDSFMSIHDIHVLDK